MESLVIDGKHVIVQEDDAVLTVAFADRPDQPTTYLLLQRLISPTEQDKRLGHDKVYIELNEQSHSAYGGIKQVQLRNNRLLLRLDDKTASLLDADQDLEVELRSDAKEVANLHAQLKRLFAGQATTIES